MDLVVERNLLQMDYNKMMKFIENPITKNIISNRHGHLDMTTHEHLEEDKRAENLK